MSAREQAIQLVKDIGLYVGDASYEVVVADYVPCGSTIMAKNTVKILPTDPDFLIFCHKDYKEVVEAAAKLSQSRNILIAAGEPIVSFP